MSKNRYEYSWNEFDCVEKVIDAQTQQVYYGCEIAVKLLNKQHKKIAKLEKQLAESEEENETFRKALQGEIFINYEIPMENERLKQQLAEKEKEIEELRFKERNIFPLVKNLEQKVAQAKTDFAIEQIQKAWDMFSEEYFANEKMETLGTRFLARLDQQIKGVKK